MQMWKTMMPNERIRRKRKCAVCGTHCMLRAVFLVVWFMILVGQTFSLLSRRRIFIEVILRYFPNQKPQRKSLCRWAHALEASFQVFHWFVLFTNSCHAWGALLMNVSYYENEMKFRIVLFLQNYRVRWGCIGMTFVQDYEASHI